MNIPLIASVMRPFIVELDSKMIKRTLPRAFRHKYHNTALKLRCKKPSKADFKAERLTHVWWNRDFVKTLKNGMCVMADRGFKHVEQYLKKSGITPVRPPSVETGVKMSKSEAKLTKLIASLRIHIELFVVYVNFICLSHMHFVKRLDDIIIIACGLINLQDSLIK
ncbi:hypothetical protein NQ317_017394 [Molorchus minor]|uniref:DDE Tnp4 domain-containing protein n=1 Tax=Molorchus minor TaxID=1323400 RepID=A0ABQ9J2F2_9CUCU|nr:hypothetical protein NQ317_017394 [Molorchus minor]